MVNHRRKPIFSKWMADLLEKRRSPMNAYWVNRDEYVFAIRWIHAKSLAWTEDCAEVFKLWKTECSRSNAALHKDMKVNFRMNLSNKKQFAKVKNSCNGKGGTAIRYYKFVDNPFIGNPCKTHYTQDPANNPFSQKWEENFEHTAISLLPSDCVDLRNAFPNNGGAVFRSNTAGHHTAHQHITSPVSNFPGAETEEVILSQLLNAPYNYVNEFPLVNTRNTGIEDKLVYGGELGLSSDDFPVTDTFDDSLNGGLEQVTGAQIFLDNINGFCLPGNKTSWSSELVNDENNIINFVKKYLE